ncbi:putative transport protein HsrA [Aquimixticola soesokkakensis]|uniref:Putative transport protein HsrA n=1 Tax=Aquimixticola soesokkakensis TaxID=1519096 RepID=A0A1Y5T7G9_9RHOB|nr:MFS transporter [Aquimixticola soesokkakensis]SLN57145.1 putative transport protein HsrA [Aquimixticola soesokkakensis]
MPQFADITESRRIAIAFVVACAFLMQGVDTTLLTIAIPVISADMGRSPLSLHVLITAYLLSLAVFMPVSGWFSDRFGARRVFVLSMGLFMAGSVITAFAPELWMMVLCRMLQGFGGAMMTPVGRMIVLRAFGPGRTLDGMTWLTVPVLIGPLIGPVIGASLIEVAPWRALFFVNTPICLAALIGALKLIPALPAEGAKRFDTLGFALAGIALVLFQLGIEAITHPAYGLVGAAILGAGAIALFLVYRRHAITLEARGQRAALALDLFKGRAFATGVIAGGIGRIGVNSMAFLLPLFLQLGLGFRPIHAGLISAISAFGSLASKPLLKRLIARHGYGRVIVGITLTSVFFLGIFATVTDGWPIAALVVLVVFAGAIRTLYFNALNTLTYKDLTDSELSRGVSTAGVFQQLNMGLGISLSAAFLTLLQGTAPAISIGDFRLTFLIMATIPLISLPFLRHLKAPAAQDLREAPHHGVAPSVADAPLPASAPKSAPADAPPDLALDLAPDLGKTNKVA